MSKQYRCQLARIWRDVITRSERDVFASRPELRRRARGDDALPQPGFVGRRYKRGGIVFIGANPGGAGVPQLKSDSVQNELLRKLRGATGSACLDAFEKLMNHLRVAMPEDWRIYDICVPPVLEGSGYTVDDIAFLNLVKWRTTAERLTGAVVRASWEFQTQRQVAALRPRVIVGLGRTVVGRYVNEFDIDREECFILKRMRGDRRLSDEGLAEAKRASRWLQKKAFHNAKPLTLEHYRFRSLAISEN